MGTTAPGKGNNVPICWKCGHAQSTGWHESPVNPKTFTLTC